MLFRRQNHEQDRDSSTDLDLILRTHRGHEASARLLWDRHAPRLIGLARALTRDTSDQAAHDIVQTVFCQILQTPRQSLKQIADVHAYLSRAVRNTALNALRADTRRAARHESLAISSPSGSPDPINVADLDAALSHLDPDHRELVILKHAAGLTFDQLALALDQNRSTIATRYAAAIAQLRDILSPSTHTPLQAVQGSGGVQP